MVEVVNRLDMVVNLFEMVFEDSFVFIIIKNIIEVIVFVEKKVKKIICCKKWLVCV